MAVVKPFRALRYDEAVAGPLETLVAPPYDVISDEQRDGAAGPEPVQRRPPDPARLRGGRGARPGGLALERRPRRRAAGRLGARTGLRRPGRRRPHALRARRLAQGRAVCDRNCPAARAHTRRPERGTAPPPAGNARPAGADLPALRRPRPAGAARARAGPRGRRREALANRRPDARPVLRRQAAPDRRRPPPLRDGGRFQRRGGISGQRADARRSRLDRGPWARDLPHASRSSPSRSTSRARQTAAPR